MGAEYKVDTEQLQTQINALSALLAECQWDTTTQPSSAKDCGQAHSSIAAAYEKLQGIQNQFRTLVTYSKDYFQKYLDAVLGNDKTTVVAESGAIQPVFRIENNVHDYSGGVQQGTVRYVSQSGDYEANGWAVSDRDGQLHYNYCGSGYEQAGWECGYAAQSMALSYVGVDAPPGMLCEGEYGKVNGEARGYGTAFDSAYGYPGIHCSDGSGGSGGYAAKTTVSNMMDSYLSDAGKGNISPVVLHFSLNGSQHTITIVGKDADGSYLALDPSGGNQLRSFAIADDGKVSGNIIGSGYYIDRVQQFIRD